MNLKLKAEELNKTLDTKVADDIEKNSVDKLHNKDNKLEDISDNRKTEDAAQQFSDQIEDLAQKRKDFILDHKGNKLEDELNELEDNLFHKSNQRQSLQNERQHIYRKDIAKELGET